MLAGRVESRRVSTERPRRHGRAGYLPCHWRSRLSLLLSHTLAIADTEPRTQASGHGARPSPRPSQRDKRGLVLYRAARGLANYKRP